MTDTTPARTAAKLLIDKASARPTLLEETSLYAEIFKIWLNYSASKWSEAEQLDTWNAHAEILGVEKPNNVTVKPTVGTLLETLIPAPPAVHKFVVHVLLKRVPSPSLPKTIPPELTLRSVWRFIQLCAVLKDGRNASGFPTSWYPELISAAIEEFTETIGVWRNRQLAMTIFARIEDIADPIRIDKFLARLEHQFGDRCTTSDTAMEDLLTMKDTKLGDQLLATSSFPDEPYCRSCGLEKKFKGPKHKCGSFCGKCGQRWQYTHSCAEQKK